MKRILFTVIFLSATSAFHAQSQTFNLTPYRLGITVADVNRSAAWYEENLGGRVYKKMEFPQYDSLSIYFMRVDKFEIELVEKRTSFSVQKYVPDYDMNKDPLEGFSKMAFQVKDIQGLNKKMKSKGVKILLEITYDKTFNVDFFLVEDPDGNLLQFIQPK